MPRDPRPLPARRIAGEHAACRPDGADRERGEAADGVDGRTVADLATGSATAASTSTRAATSSLAELDGTLVGYAWVEWVDTTEGVREFRLGGYVHPDWHGARHRPHPARLAGGARRAPSGRAEPPPPRSPTAPGRRRSARRSAISSSALATRSRATSSRCAARTSTRSTCRRCRRGSRSGPSVTTCRPRSSCGTPMSRHSAATTGAASTPRTRTSSAPGRPGSRPGPLRHRVGRRRDRGRRDERDLEGR